MSRNMKVVLFGMTGDGKSTVANALVTGGIENVIFQSSDGAEGCTSAIQTETGRGWTVTDTIGVGEAKTGTVSNFDAQKKLTEFLKEVRGEYSHVIYVKRATRVTTIDELTFMLFRQTFAGAEDAFVILFTEADEEWLKDNKDRCPKYMKDIKTLVVDIPPISDRPFTEKKNQQVRERSIEKLQQNLVEIFEMRGKRYSLPNIARMNEKELKETSRDFMGTVKKWIMDVFDPKLWKTVAVGISSIFDICELVTGA